MAPPHTQRPHTSKPNQARLHPVLRPLPRAHTVDLGDQGHVLHPADILGRLGLPVVRLEEGRDKQRLEGGWWGWVGQHSSGRCARRRRTRQAAR